MKTSIHTLILSLWLLLLLPLSARAYYSPEQGRWLSRDPIGDDAFAWTHSGDSWTSQLRPLKGAGQLLPYPFVQNNAIDRIDVLGLSSDCDWVTPYNAGRVSFRGFSPEKLSGFILISEEGGVTGSPANGGSSDRIDGFWWKGIRTHWYKIPDFCSAIVEPEFSDDGFSVDWCCIPCMQLACEVAAIFKSRPCTPGFVPNSGNTSIGKYPFTD